MGYNIVHFSKCKADLKRMKGLLALGAVGIKE